MNTYIRNNARWGHRAYRQGRRGVALVGGFASMLLFMLPVSAENNYVAHEWGTFTSIQGSDGATLHWNPFTKADLPQFVYDRNQPLKGEQSQEVLADFWIPAKSSQMWQQRMETPVIYFYPDKPMTVNVQVDFPQGQITEWYPQVSQFGPAAALQNFWPASSRSFLSWQKLQLLNTTSEPAVLKVDSKNHYFAARTENASVVKTGSTLDPKGKPESEKFLFYRGVGNFATPLKLFYDYAGELTLQNTTREPLRHLFLLKIEKGNAELSMLKDLGKEEGLSVKGTESMQGTVPDIARNLSASMEKALIAEGLYPQEAAAMVNTWRDSWFEEEGVRVLYILPRKWTDEILPLKLDPAPRELVRVMVGRSEVFSPETESKLRRLFSQTQSLENSPEAIAQLRRLPVGRFLEPALTRLAHIEAEAVRRKVAAISAQISSGRNEVVAR